MKFRCERDTLVEALTTASRAVTTRGSTTAALTGVRVEIAGNQLTAVGTDLDLTVRVDVEAIGLDDGVVIAPARLAADIVRALEPGAVTFEGGEDEVEISAARSRFVVRTFSVDDFPVLPEPRVEQVQLPVAALAEALRQVVRAASGDDARPLLTGVLVAAEGGGTRFVATDSYRLALRDLAGSGPLPEGTEQILVPARALTELQRLLPSGGKDDDTATVGFSVSGLDATFSVAGVRLTTRLLDGRFPDYRQLIPPGYPNKLRVGKEALLDALRRVRLLVRDNTTPVRLSMRPGSVELTVVSQEVGHASEDVDAEFDGEELTVAFNPTYLIDGVEAVLDDEVLLETIDATKPATVRGPEHDDYRYLLMPVRVS
ncbi:MAG TPA: DNA polymerase III subunit beta [Acidimicrobiales bacterium]|nr:DNA polymerase III subunit beta [Acidimicrobiales bacterium]